MRGRMTALLYLDDSYLKEFQARVTELAEDGVVLEQTAFYVGGGGQPSDTGQLLDQDRQYPVSGLARSGGKAVHRIQGQLSQVGANVTGLIDWDRRYSLMRTHTALHILCGVIWGEYGALVTGGDMRPGEARMDFELEHMSAQFANEIEEKINAAVLAARHVVVGNLSREEADVTPDLIRTKINLLPPNIREVRTINIEGLDLQADGETHVSNTQEVGAIKVVGHESKGRINKRLRIALEEI